MTIQSTPIQPCDRAPQIEWTRSGGRWTDEAPLECEDTVVVGSLLHKAYGYDSQTGKQRWATDIGNKLSDFRKVGNDVVIGRSGPSASSASPDDTQHAFGLDAQSGQVLWERDLHPWGRSSWVSPHNSLLIHTNDGRLERVDPHTGESIWSRKVALGDQPGMGPDGSLVVVDNDDSGSPPVISLDPNSGATRWSYRPGGWVQGLEVSPQGVLLTTLKQTPANEARHLFVLDPVDGQPRATLKLPRQGLVVPPCFGPDGKVYLVAPTSNGVTVTAVEPDTGNVAWTREEAQLADHEGRAFVLDGDDLFLATYKHGDSRDIYGHAVRSLGTEAGQVRWTFEPTDVNFLSVRAACNGTVFVAGQPTGEFGNVLYAVDRETGVPRWCFDPGTHIHDVILGPDGQVMIQAEEDGYRLHVLDLETGEPAWQFNTGDRLYVTPSDSSPQRLHTVDHEGNLFALRWDQPGQEGSYEGGPPRDPGQSTGASDYHGSNALLTGEFAGSPALWLDRNSDGQITPGRDYLLLRDRNCNGRIDFDELAAPPTLEELTALDLNGDGLISQSEWQGHGLCFWRDLNSDGRIGGGELSDPGLESGLYAVFDLERTSLEFSGSDRFDNGHVRAAVPGQKSASKKEETRG